MDSRVEVRALAASSVLGAVVVAAMTASNSFR
jgi:hypothetical protein